MKILYLDCFSGISGDMFVGALLDAGVALNDLLDTLSHLKELNYDISVEKVLRNSISGSKFTVKDNSTEPQHRHLSDILKLIDDKAFSPFVKDNFKKIFKLLASAEAKIHCTSPEKIHFHEVGAVDSIIDVLGTIICIEHLGIDKIICSPLPVGSGFVVCQHGKIPVPSPATLEILKGKPIVGSNLVGETVTPTGAALAVGLSSEFGNMPPMTVEKIGYGAGSRDGEMPNLLRAIIGSTQTANDLLTDKIWVIETNIDDMNPQFYEHIFELCLSLGALDVTITPVQMKKNRPGNNVCVLCRENQKQILIDFLLKETSSLGVRLREETRIILDRELAHLESPFGTVSIKIGRTKEGKIINIAPEWEDCRKLAQSHNVPVKIVFDKVKALAVLEFL